MSPTRSTIGSTDSTQRDFNASFHSWEAALPFSVAVSGGLVYAAQTFGGRVVQFNPNDYDKTFTSFGTSGSGSGQFRGPLGVAASVGEVFVTDNGNYRIVQFDPNDFAGSFTSFGSLGTGRGQFGYPEGVAVDGLGNVFVADADNNRIVQLSTVPEPSGLALAATSILTVLAAGACRRHVGNARGPAEQG